MLGDIFTRERQFLNYFFDTIDRVRAEEVLLKFLGCKGMIVFTGVGKSGIIAEKLAKTMVSTGTRSMYLPPTGAFHGELGVLTPDDLVVFLSKSGMSSEVVDLAQLLKKRGIQTMAWVSSRKARLSDIVDFSIELPLQGEICPFDLAPTTSTVVQLIFGDVLAVGLMQAKKFSLDQYALNHPGGAIGKQIAEKVEDVMIKEPHLPICQKSTTLQEVLIELSKKRLGCVLVVDEKEELLGIFTDGDLRRALEVHQEAVFKQPLEAIMTKDPVSTTPDRLTSHALSLMEGDRKVMMLPVTKEKKVVGVIHIHHILSPLETPSL